MMCFNLIPAARRQAKKRRARVRFWIAATSTYGVVVLASLIASRLLSAFDDRALAKQMTSVESDLAKSLNDAKVLRGQYQRVHALWDTQNIVSEQPDWSLLLALLAQAAGDEVVFRDCRLQPVEVEPTAALTGEGVAQAEVQPKPTSDSFVAQIAGLGRTQSAVSQFVLRLDQLRLFTQVRLVETRREPFLDAEAIAFRIECSIAQAPEASP